MLNIAIHVGNMVSDAKIHTRIELSNSLIISGLATDVLFTVITSLTVYHYIIHHYTVSLLMSLFPFSTRLLNMFSTNSVVLLCMLAVYLRV